jgi:preprotein translocase subunit SecB
MIPLSPLQLKQHFFTVICLKAVPKPAKDGKPHLKPTVRCKADPTKPNHWRLNLYLKLESAVPEKPFPYEGEVEIQGLVEVSNKFAAGKREQLAKVNGMSLLYSAAREMLLNLTARSAHGALCLPTLNFQEVFANDHKGEEQKAAEKPD